MKKAIKGKKKIVRVKECEPFTIRFIETNEPSKFDAEVFFPEKMRIANEILSKLIIFDPLEKEERYKKEKTKKPS